MQQQLWQLVMVLAVDEFYYDEQNETTNNAAKQQPCWNRTDSEMW